MQRNEQSKKMDGEQQRGSTSQKGAWMRRRPTVTQQLGFASLNSREQS